MSFISDSRVREQLRDHEIAGGDGYQPDLHPADADVSVDSIDALRDALDSSAEIIHLEDGRYDATGEELIDLGDKTVLGSRGWDGSDGPTIFTHSRGLAANRRPYTLFCSEGSPRLSGLRIRGPRYSASDTFTRWDYDENLARGVMLEGPGGEVDNCELWGWTWNAIHVKGRGSGTRIDQLTDAEIHHNHLHRSLQIGYGYGLSIWRGLANIHHNYCNEHRHSITLFGFPETGYSITDNIFGPAYYSHAVDAHCLTENGVSESMDRDDAHFGLRAGGQLAVRRNVFLADRNTRGNGLNGVTVRGEPLDGAWIERNHTVHAARPSSNSGNSQTGQFYRQVNVSLNGWPDLRDTERGFTSNFHTATNHYDIETIDWELFATDRPATGDDGHDRRGIEYEQAADALRESRAALTALREQFDAR